MVEVTQKHTVTTRMIMQMVKTDVINSTSAKLNLTPFNLKNTLKNITLLSKVGSQKYLNIYKLMINKQKIRIKDKVNTTHI